MSGEVSCPPQHLDSLHLKRVLGVRTKEPKRLHREKNPKAKGGGLCAYILELVSSQLTEVQVGTMVCICVPDALVPVGACAL